MTYDEMVERTVRIMRDLHELKEDILFTPGLSVQPGFDAGMIEAAIAILRANVDDENYRVTAERQRQATSRLTRVLGLPGNPPPPASDVGGIERKGI